MIVDERTAWHGDSSYKHSSADVGKQFSGRRALFERETDEGHIVDYIISETLRCRFCVVELIRVFVCFALTLLDVAT